MSFGGADDPKVAKIFAYGKCLCTNTMLLHGLSDLEDRQVLKTRHSMQGSVFGWMERCTRILGDQTRTK